MKKSGYISIDKGRIYWESYGNGVPIIVLHGGPGLTMDYLLPHMADLKQFGEVIFYDQRGTGKSIDSDISPAFINIDQFVKDLEDIRIALNIEKFFVIGHSFGAFLAMSYSIQYSQHLLGMVLLSSLPANFKGQLEFSQEADKRMLPLQEELEAWNNIKLFNQLNIDEINNVYEKIFTLYLYNKDKISDMRIDFEEKSAKNGYLIENEMSKHSIFHEDVNLFPILKKSNIPTLIIHGMQDVIPISTAYEIHSAIPNSKFITLDECDHFPFVDQKDQTLAAIADFIEDSASIVDGNVTCFYEVL